MKDLTSIERRALRARAHHLHPIIMVGSAGLTPTVLHEINIALNSHELIKIRVLGDDRLLREKLIGEICPALAASLVQHIGKMLVIYRPRPEAAAAPGARPRRKEKRRTKRSYQNR